MKTLSTLALALILIAPAAHADDWSGYFSGGPSRAGDRITVPGFGQGTVVGDFRVVGEGTSAGSYQYAVMIATPAGTNGPNVGVSIVMVQQERNGTVTVTQQPQAAGAVLAGMDARMLRAADTILQHTQAGRAINRRAMAEFTSWNRRNDRSNYRLTTPAGLAELGVDMAISAGTARAASAMNGPNRITNIIGEALINATGSAASSSLPHSLPPMDANTAANVELTRGGINALLERRLGNLNPRGREAAIAYILTQAGGRLMTSPDDSAARSLFNAATDLAVTWGLPPVVGPLAQEALELARQFDGYSNVLRQQGLAGAEFTAAINEFNFIYGARQTFARANGTARPVVEASALAFWRYYGNYEFHLQDAMLEYITANNLGEQARDPRWVRANFPRLLLGASQSPRLRDYLRFGTADERAAAVQRLNNTLRAEIFRPRLIDGLNRAISEGRVPRPLRTSMAPSPDANSALAFLNAMSPSSGAGNNAGRTDETRPLEVAAHGSSARQGHVGVDRSSHL